MAKEKSSKDKSTKKEKKDKSKPSGISKPSKRENTISPDNAEKILSELESNAVNASATEVDEPMLKAASATTKPQGALVPFANPLADEKTAKKVFKSVKKANKAKSLKRGVKEVVKALRKSPPTNPSTPATNTPIGVVIIAADISPMDVISHLPVLCEDHGIPYLYVTSRAELGAAGQTKRPTSVVMVGKDKGKAGSKKKEKKEGEKEEKEEDWDEVYGELVKVVRKAGRDVRI